MRKQKYQRECKRLFKKAKRLGVKLDFTPENFDYRRLNCLWHGGSIALIEISPELQVELCAYGDVIVTLYDKKGEYLARSKDKSNNGAFEDNMYSYLKTDKQLSLAIEEGRLVFENNNWIEYDGYVLDKNTGKTRFVDLGMIYDNIIDDNILKAIEEVLDSLDEIKEQILETAKEGEK